MVGYSYKRVSSGNCDSLVTSKEECELAATILGLSDTDAYEDDRLWPGRPRGCIYASNNWLQWHDQNSLDPCGSNDGSNDYDCLCKKDEGDDTYHF